MKRSHSFFYQVIIFIAAQLAWLSLLSLWIYWYVTNYMIFSRAGDSIAMPEMARSTNVFALVSGLVLMVAISVGMWLLFRRLSIQYHLTQLYDNFIANVTHELKSPLASIQLYLETLHRHRIARNKQDEFIVTMLKDTDRLNRLINAILEIPGLQHKTIAHHFDVQEVDTVMRQVLKDAIDQFQLPPNTVHIKGKAPCHCVLDVNAIRIVVHNLVDNAKKYSPKKLQLTVRLGCDEKNALISFQDRGIGIEEKDQKNIFKKFFRIYDRRIPSVKGTGLGLYWVHEIIKFHGGRITLFSEGRDKGSTFTITLPIYRTHRKRYAERLIKLSQKYKASRMKHENEESLQRQ
ncbi:HAMP domain-containing histidine kinase [candidate division KSB1 bacterium]|nr:HAMP domain-containing histidine kinase [candidate division KSB1 bacterium]